MVLLIGNKKENCKLYSLISRTAKCSKWGKYGKSQSDRVLNIKVSFSKLQANYCE